MPGLITNQSHGINPQPPRFSPLPPGVEQQATGRKHRPDYGILIAVLLLLVVGLIVIYSISPALSAVAHVGSSYYISKQMIAVAIGLLVFVIVAQVPLNVWQQLTIPLAGLAGLVTLVAIALPVNPNYPAHRWLRLGSFSFQSVELLKFALLIWLATFLAERIRTGTITDFQRTLKPILIVLAVIGVVVVGIQSDLGSMGVIVAMIGSMLFIAGVPLRRLAIIVGIIIIGVVLAVSITPYRRDRLAAYLHPASDCQGSGYQACQAMIAVGSGGMIGLGLGSSVQAYGYLPEAANDSIFAIYAEKFGFIGSVILLGILAVLFSRLQRVAEHSPDDRNRLLAIGVLSWLSVQSLINIGAMIGVLPLKGITLPFVSYGGTSVIFAMAAAGLVFQISRYTMYASGVGQRNTKGPMYDNHTNRRRIRGAYHPNLGSR